MYQFHTTNSANFVLDLREIYNNQSIILLLRVGGAAAKLHRQKSNSILPSVINAKGRTYHQKN